MRSLLDDAAAHATADLRIDLAQVRQQAALEPTAHRRGWVVTALAVAATIVLIVVLLPGRSVLRGSVQPADEPAPLPAVTGVPANWYDAPVWTPPVTRHPMTAAVMVLEATIKPGGVGVGIRGPILVSADGGTYASLPSWTDRDAGLLLSPDGRTVAWYTSPSATEGSAVHLLTLATGKQVDVPGARGRTPVGLVWDQGSLVLTTADESIPGAQSESRISLDGRTGPNNLGTSSRAIYPASSGRPVPSPDGQRTAVATLESSAWSVQLRPLVSSGGPQGLVRQKQWAPKDIAVQSAEPVTEVAVLAWTAAGIYARVETSRGPGEAIHRSIRLINPDTGAQQVVSRPHDASRTFPIALATDLVAALAPLPGAPPSFDTWDRAHLRFLAGQAWGQYSLLIVFNAALLAAIIVGLASWRVRRRRARTRTTKWS